MQQDQLSGRSESWSQWVFAAVVAYLLIAYTTVYLVDVFNVGGVRSWFHGIGSEGVWYSLFQETSPTEWLQWLALGTGAMIAGHNVGSLARIGRVNGQRMFWTILGFALVLMLIEDAGDPRDKIAQYAAAVVGDERAWHVAEFTYYVAIASVPLLALLRYGSSIWHQTRTRTYVLAGFVFYAIAGGTSSVRYAGNWYERAGGLIDQYVMLGKLPRADKFNSHEFWLMDTIFEESLELLGATSFLAAALAFMHYLRVETRAQEGLNTIR